MSFEKHSNFNKLANFSEVKFGENKPVLEVELNEMQQIQNEARADIIRDTMPSGFVTLGDIDYEYCANNDNQIKLKTESIAYVNGYRITIPKDTIIEIGEADKVREDLVFLEVWKEEVTSDSTLTNQGGEGQKEITNSIKDSRYPVETSHRIALKWRIRHVANIDFSTYNDYGFCKLSDTSSYNTTVCPQGARTSLPTSDEIKKAISGYTGAFFRNLRYSNIQNASGKEQDNGLYIVGWNNKTNSSNHLAVKNFFKTFDGYIYAIPMFRLKRKPNVGLASPFEYKKIHNQLDPKKFAHLVGQENVEKVHSVNIKGTTYKNLNNVVEDSYVLTAGNGAGVSKSIIKPNHYRWSKDSGNNSFYPKLGLINSSFSPNTVYTIQYTIESNINFGHGFCIAYGDAYVGKSTPDVFYNEAINYSTPKATIKRVFTTRTPTSNTSNEICIGFSSITTPNPCWCEISNLIILEGDYSHVEDLTLLPGIQSLGETNNNSITVENNLLEEGTYVHELQNHILPTHPEVTHVTWGEDVVIPPEVEIELKNGEEVIQTITQLPVKLETTGEEKLHVKTMKGKTLVNLCNASNRSETLTSSSRIFYCKIPYTIKANSVCTIFAKISNSTTSGNINLQLAHPDGTYSYPKIMDASTNGVVNTNIVNAKDITNILIYISNVDTGQVTVSDVMIIEGDYTNVNVPYFKGMQSVKVPVLTTTGKNLLDISQFDKAIEDGKNVVYLNNYTPNIPYKENTQYFVKYTSKYTKGYATKIKIEHTDGTKKETLFSSTTFQSGVISSEPNKTVKSITFFQNTLDNTLKCGVYVVEETWIEEGGTSTSYEPFKSNILSTPEDLELHGIGDVQDTLDYLTGEVTQRVDSIILKENDGISLYGGVKGENTIAFRFSNLNINPKWLDVRTKPNLLSTTFPTTTYDKCLSSNFEDKEGMCLDTSNGDSTNAIVIRILKSRLISEDVAGIRDFISKNKIDIVSELNKPTVKTVDLTEDDYVGKSKITYQLAEPLNYIPNGAYDEIKGDKLIKRTNKIYLDGTETWGKFSDETTTTYRTSFNIADGKPSSVCVCSHFEYGTGASVEKVKIYITVNANLSITVLKSDFPTLESFKTWLSNNRPMVIYELANPIEIPLKEVSPLDVDFSLNRQFKRGYENYLKELPNGVKDVVENGKVKRNVGSVSLGDFAPDKWNLEFSNENYLAFDLRELGFHDDNPYTSHYRFSNVLPFITHEQYTQADTEGLRFSSIPALVISKSRLTTPNASGLVTWLRSNNVSMLYQLNSPTTEELTEENKRYVPYMPLNSYVGSLYVADGINQTKFLTAFSPSEYEVQTYHRYFSNEFNVFEDITLKKSPYGHKTYLEEVDGKYVEKFIAGLEKHEIEDLRHKVSLTGFDYSQLLQDSFLKLIKGELS